MADSTTDRRRLLYFGTDAWPTVFFPLRFFSPLIDRNPHRGPRCWPQSMTLLGLGTTGLVGLTIFGIATDVRMVEVASALAETSPAEPADPVQKLESAKVFNTNCADCHDVDGTGEKGRKGMPTVPNFGSPAWQMSQTDIEITHQIQEGTDPVMPAYRDKLSKQQILGLTVYIRAFAIHSAAPIGFKPEKPPSTAIASRMSTVQIYRAYCLACHDSDGRGETVRKAMPPIPNFTDPKWQDSQSDADLRNSIMDGKGKFMLPMNDKVSEAEIGPMLAYVRAFGGRKQVVALEPQKRPIPPRPVHPTNVPVPASPSGLTIQTSETAARLRVATGLYRQYCVSCHGADARGTAMRASMPAIPDFTDRAWQGTQSDPQLLSNILDGKGKFMPAFRGRLSNVQTHDLVAYIRAFGPPETKIVEATASDFEKRFQQLQHQWDELEKQMHKPRPSDATTR